MNEIIEMYNNMGISPAVYAYGEATISRLKKRFDEIDQVAEFNQAKVLAAFLKNRVSATCFAASTGTVCQFASRRRATLTCWSAL